MDRNPGDAIPVGKVPVALLTGLLAELAPCRDDVRLGPAVGEDACALEVGDEVLIAATDPITLTGTAVGRHAVIVNANDVAVMGARPRWFLVTILLPPGATEAQVRDLLQDVSNSVAEVGAALVGGHTEVTGAVTRPVLVGQMLGIAPAGAFVTTGGARAGDVLVQVGAVPVEGAAVLATEAAGDLADVDADVVRVAASGLDDPGISVVEAALAATELGAVAMHDPTEGGLAAGLHELAIASGVALRVDPSRVCWFEPGLTVCRALGADPWATLASGSLLVAFSPDRAESARAALRAHGHQVSVLGAAEQGSGVHDLGGRPILWPERDEVARLLGD